MSSRVMSRREFRLTGYHVLFAVVAFFVVVGGVNAVFITAAVRSFPGLATDEPFTRGLAKNFNAERAAIAEQAARGWTATLTEEPAAGAEGAVTVAFADVDGRPISGLAVEGVLARAVEAASDHALTFEDEGGGRYSARIADLAPGDWTLTLTTAFPDGAPFEAQRRLWIE